MNPCHVCSIVTKKSQIISCDSCENQYCYKCIRAHIMEPIVQKTIGCIGFQTIKKLKNVKAWRCFQCSKVCLCRPCKGIGLTSIEKQLLGKKQKVIVKRSIQEYQPYFNQLEIFKNVNISQLTPFEKEYFISKVMLYCRSNDNYVPTKKLFDLSIPKGVIQKNQTNKNVISIDSDQGQERIEQQQNQIKQKNQNNEQVAIQLQSNADNELVKNCEAIKVEESKQIQQQNNQI